MIVGTSILTFGIRYLPMIILREVRLRPRVDRLLRNLPIGILSALVAQAVFLRDGVLDLGLSNFYLYGLLALLLIASIGRSLAALIFGGIAVVGLLTFLSR
jgi:branched-subunit amino acid transport protein